MTEPVITPVPASEATPAPPPAPRRRWRSISVAALLLAFLALAALAFWANSSAVENFVRRRLVNHLQTATGGRVEIGSFHWSPWQLEAQAEDVVIHGLEEPSEAPYATIGHLSVKASLLGLWSPRLILRSLEIDRPTIHLIVYRDGSTNQPHPRRPQSSNKSSLDTLFDLQAGQFSVTQGLIDFDSRADQIDFEERLAPLDFNLADLNLQLAYLPPANGTPESYRLQSSASLLHLLRGGKATWAKSAQGSFEATFDLLRNAAYLRSFKLHSGKHTLNLTGALENFSRPRWQADLQGDVDLAIVEPISGFPRTPAGIAHLALHAAGGDGQFHCDGPLHVDQGTYIDREEDINIREFDLDAMIHADPRQLLISSVSIRPRQGGQMTGEVKLSHWISSIPGSAEIQATSAQTIKKSKKTAPSEPAKPAAPAARPLSREGTPIFLPIDGEVKANFHDVTLDTMLDWLSVPPFQRLGIDASLNGSAWSTWQRGDDHTLLIGSNFALSPSGRPQPGEAPANGLLDTLYTHIDGVIAVHSLDLHLPANSIQARGRMSVYPLVGPTSLAVDLHSENLFELDTVLRDLELERKGQKGTPALPIALSSNGQFDFHGTWNGTLIDPHLNGSMSGKNLDIEMPTPQNPTQMVHWDSVSASGTYAATHATVDHGRMKRGAAEIELDGSILTPHAPDLIGRTPLPTFDGTSILRMKLHAANVGMADIQPFFGSSLPVSGRLNAILDTDGPASTLSAAGWIELMDGVAYGEPFHRIHAQGKLADQVASISQMTITHAAGTLTANGSYDLRSSLFQIHAKGIGLDLARIASIQKADLPVSGSLTVSIDGSGSQQDPKIQARAALNKFALGGEPLGSLEFAAHTANQTAFYQMTSRLDAAKLDMQGQTALAAPNNTSARIEFSRLNIDALLRMAHLSSLNGESDLAGSVTLDGPLATPEKMRGEAHLQQLAATIHGVHLQSPGGLHATLNGGHIVLDPLHITGENTDLNLQANLGLEGQRPLNLAASGTVNLKLAETIDHDITATGATTFAIEAHGPLANPELKGRVEFRDGALALEDLPNGLSQIRGLLEFNRNRLEVRSLTAMTGGGLLSLSGYVAYQNGLYADLAATGSAIRIRYPQGISSLADATLHLQGAQNNLLLSGNVVLTRFAINPEFDVAALAAQANAVHPTPSPDAPSNHIRLDLHLSSSPQLNFQNALAKLAGNVDLRVRGTLASPSLLGRVSVTEGSAMIAGTRYDLERGDIYFTNPVRILPNIDLSATAHVEDYDITLGVHGTSDKLNVSYRSDPPLPEADVVALLALGRTQSQQRLYTQQQQQSISNPTTDALLGGALNATVSSRVQKLFGVGSVKVDPNYLGAMGASTSRVIVEEQLGPYVSLTYATNTNTTAQQLLQTEIAINRHVSLLVSRDESGVFSMVIKATRRFR